MSLTPDEIAAAATALFTAEKSRNQIGLLSHAYPDATMDDAYAIQAALVKCKLAEGRRIIGWKIGLTSKAMQDALKIGIPDSGILFDDMVFANGAVIPDGRFIQPRVEAEIAFIMKAPLKGPGITRAEVLAATCSVAPALEILDTRILRVDPETKTPRSFVDTIADNAANAGIVLGEARHAPNAFDLRWVGAIVARNGEVEETGLGAGVLDDPASGIAWLANRLDQYGDSISAGDVVLSGSFIRPIEARRGDTFHADFAGFGEVRCEFI
jgi:2-oxo-hept-3-ene-1,7-dioate hydratase